MKKPKVPIERRSAQTPVPPTTTEQQDIVTASQRKVNLIWEYTQSIVALVVVVVALTAAAVAQWKEKEVSSFLSFICGNVIGFYFSRTNHEKTGGVGPKKQDEQYYTGR